MNRPRSLPAPNPGPFTLDGTRSYLVGRRRVAVVDPGPPLDSHVRSLLRELAGAAVVAILLTHRHRDHAGAAEALRRATGAPVLAAAPGGDGLLRDGDEVETDAGRLAAVATPGHSPDHLAFHWREARAVFTGDLVLGAGGTTLVADLEGDVAAYLGSLDRIEALDPLRIYPGHGPPVDRVRETIRAFREHRLARVREVARAREADPGASPGVLARAVYGEALPPGLGEAATASVRAILRYLDEGGGEGTGP